MSQITFSDIEETIVREDAMTPRQRAFIATLWAERDHEGIEVPPLEAMTKKSASAMIGELLARPRVPVAPANPLPDVPAGHYALPGGEPGVILFYKVDRPTEGRWAGHTFVSRQASDEYFPVRGESAKSLVLEAIVAYGPKESTVLYGHELGVCGVCGRTLTDETSRANGIGPVCIKRF